MTMQHQLMFYIRYTVLMKDKSLSAAIKWDIGQEMSYYHVTIYIGSLIHSFD